MLELTTQILIKPGIVKMELVITEGLKKLSSMQFELEVIESLNNEESIESTNEFTALVNGLASLNEYDNYKNEIKSARGSEDNLKSRLDKTDTTLVEALEKANDWDEFKKAGGEIGGVIKIQDLLVGEASKSSTGYSKLTNGLIMQWGTLDFKATSGRYDTGSRSFPIAFPTWCMTVLCAHHPADFSSWTDGSGNVYAVGLSQFRAVIPVVNTKSYSMKWIAFGY